MTVLSQYHPPVGARPYQLVFGMGGDLAAVTTGDHTTLRAPTAFTLTGVKASLYDDSSSGVVELALKKNGVDMLSTNVTIDSGEKTSVTAAIPAVISVTAVAADDELTVEVIDDGTAATGAVFVLEGTIP